MYEIYFILYILILENSLLTMKKYFNNENTRPPTLLQQEI